MAWKIIGALPFFFGFIVSMAIANGQSAAMWLETDEAKEGKVFQSGRARRVWKQYKQRNPTGRRLIHMRNALFAAGAFALGLFCYIWFMSR